MTIKDPHIQEHVESTRKLMRNLPEAQLTVVGRLDVYAWFRIIEDEDSPRTQEAIGHLLSPELRPTLRQWYRKHGNDMNPFAIELRDRLRKISGEQFG